MKKYRIVKTKYFQNTTWSIEKKSIFGFWYNPLNIDVYTTGVFDSFKKAKDALNSLLYKPKKLIVFEIKK